jgi:hypothetical protein
MMMAQQVIEMHTHYLTIYEKCRLLYRYEKLVLGVSNKASLCRQIGIDWESYYYSKHILEKQYDQQEYKDKLEELKYKLSHEDKRDTPEKNRIRYAFKKIRSWDKEIKTMEGIPKTVRWFRSGGHSNMFIEYLIRNKISKITKPFGPFSLLQPCLCCGSRLCECEPNHMSGECPISFRRSRFEDIDLADWMERDGFCVCGHRSEMHQIGWITEGDIIIPYECRDCDCYSNLSDYFLILAYPIPSSTTTGDCKK